ncbi:DNA polymerase III subunits gamma and tau [Legionella birminghamensis]|uniref:DNA polymerase III subunit gamma/tau n=1 Tax=Legionella birminghamensis TaxID=28083 RepID=A0A378ICJ1_9GAMM|nr:DNA polymerase III subunit gamma/tau [Legionella birminghamensis]KTC66822.1 DNA polymerase III subunits gamma and tau [Legionella birminghamensis]STX32947.1 DNA polymerase III, gamma and tau subunits [Legionella birminghamensis]
MSYLALARKWRPRSFSQLVGQEHINKAITKSLAQQRIHHAYLFTGTRGVGKTSIARLMAKALNCEQGISAEPCLSCDTCQAIEQGRFIDLIEIDGASKTRVEDTRELLENVQYATTAGRYKIYLIDEVHMLSQHSFNALLKTLEEPPEHVKFLLATTDPQKLPSTVLSRCLQFNLRPLAPTIIIKQLELILSEENYSFEPQALELIARAAKGSMRDALSILDQAIATADQHLTAETAKSLLGYTKQDYALSLLQALQIADAAQIISVSRQIAEEGGHFIYVLEELLNHLHQISISQALTSPHPLIEFDAETQRLAKQLQPADVQLFYQIALKGIEEIHLAPSLLTGFEMTLLRMLSFKPVAMVSLPSLTGDRPDPSEGSKIPEPADLSSPFSPIQEPLPEEAVFTAVPFTQQPEPIVELDLEPETSMTPQPMAEEISRFNSSFDTIDDDWRHIISQLKLGGLALTAVENAEFIKRSEKDIYLQVAKGHHSLFSPGITQRIEQALSDYYKTTIRINLSVQEAIQSSPAQVKQIEQTKSLQEAEKHLQEDPVLQQIIQEFSGEIVKNSIVPNKDTL